MPAQTSFRQACPSCEAMVPIKDASLVGKKADCPKCKYRFVVEEPKDEDVKKNTKIKTRPDAKGKAGGVKKRASEVDDDPDAAPKKKKGGNNTMLIVGGVVGLLAVVGLIIGAIVIFGGGDDKPAANNQQPNTGAGQAGNTGTKPAGGAPTPNTPNNNPNNQTASNNTGQQGPPPGSNGNLVNVTNLLPNETQAIYAINMVRFRDSTLGGSIFRSGSGFQPQMFRDGLGLPSENMHKFVRAASHKNKWAFNVIQMYETFSVKPDALKAKLGANKGPKSPIKGFDYFVVNPNEIVEGLAAIDFGTLLGAPASPPAPTGQTITWHLYDDHTVIIAELGEMEKFLTANRSPTLLTQYNGDSSGGSSAPNMPGMPMMPGGAGGAGAKMPVVGGSGGANPPAGGAGGSAQTLGPNPNPMGSGGSSPPTPPAGGGGNSNAIFSDKPTYLTVKPELKRLLDQLEETKDSRSAMILSAGAIDLENSNVKIADAIRAASGLGASLPLPTIVSAGASLHVFTDERLYAVAQLELKHEEDARKVDGALKTIAFPLVGRQLGSWMGGIAIDVGERAATNNPGGFNPGPGGGANGPPPGMLMPRPPGAGGGPGLPPAMGVGGAGGGGRPNQGGSMGPPPNMAGGGGGSIPPPPGAMGSGGATPGSTDNTKPAANSFLNSSFSGKTVYITADLEINKATDEKIRMTVENRVVRLKGMTDVQGMTQPRWHELAQTANALRSQKLATRGTYPIAGEGQSFGSTTFVSRTPNQRVSFLVDLLPFLGKQEIYDQIKKDKPWRDEDNLRAAGNWIPAFINPKYPQKSWTVRLPSLPDFDLGATHFVGLSGIGMDSAEYDLTNPVLAKKAGLFNYNAETRLDNIPDGASNTIFMIQVPPTYQRPWIAGGGATIMGVPEKNSAAPFMSMQANGKRGTYALMADGSVRWISDTISDAAFQAAATRAGEDASEDWGANTQLVPPPAGGIVPVVKPAAPKPAPPPPPAPAPEKK